MNRRVSGFISVISVMCLLQWCSAYHCYGQVQEVNGLDIPLYEGDKPYFLINCGEEGAVLYRHVRQSESGTEKHWEVLMLDTALNRHWHSIIMTNHSQTIIGGYHDDGYIYLLVLDYSKVNKRYLIMRMDITDQSIDYFELGQYVPETLDFLRVHNGSIILGGSDKNKPSMVCYRYGSRLPTVLQGIYGRQNSVLGIDLLEKGGFIVYLGIRTSRRSRTVSINLYSDDGAMHSQHVLQPTGGRLLLDCRVVVGSVREGSMLGAGLYSADHKSTASGIFTVLIKAGGVQEFKYYSFDHLRNFFNYLPPDQRERRLTRIANRREKGKEDVHSEYVLLRSPRSIDGKAIMIGECYMRNNKIYDPYYGWKTGFIFSHAFYIGIRNDGKVWWDNSMAIEARGERSELQKTFVHESGTDLLAVSYDEPHLYYKRIGARVQADTVVMPPERVTLFDQPATYSDMIIRRWYDDHYLVFGSRRIENGHTTESSYAIRQIDVGAN